MCSPRLHYMERRGSGIDRIMTSYAECAQKPVFYSDSTFFLVTLPNRSVAAPAQLSMESENVETSTQKHGTTAQNVETSPQNVETSAFSTPIEKLERRPIQVADAVIYKGKGSGIVPALWV